MPATPPSGCHIEPWPNNQTQHTLYLSLLYCGIGSVEMQGYDKMVTFLPLLQAHFLDQIFEGKLAHWPNLTGVIGINNFLGNNFSKDNLHAARPKVIGGVGCPIVIMVHVSLMPSPCVCLPTRNGLVNEVKFFYPKLVRTNEIARSVICVALLLQQKNLFISIERSYFFWASFCKMFWNIARLHCRKSVY